ncbi:MAG TPA: Calx-beta domain-containing protein [Chryseolinea sp.]
MQKFTLLICSLCALVVLGIGLNSCKDEEPFVKPNLKVSEETKTVAEGAGTIQVEFVLDRGAPGDITIEYSLGGTAISPADYTIVGKEGEVNIANGQTSGTVEIQIVSDAIYEGNETIEISIEDVSSADVLITNDDESVVTITDDDPQITASFATATQTVSEAAGILELNVTLSQAAPSAVTLQYTLAGTATDSVTARNADPDIPTDYAIRGGTPGTLQIAAGQTTGVIKLALYSDFEVEDGDPATAPWDPETISITLTQASAGVMVSATSNIMEIKVNQQDGKVIALFWDENTTIDMDLFLWIGELGTAVADLELVSLSASDDTEGPEVVFIPAVIKEVKMGVTYTYYAGDVTPMNFESHFINFAAGALGTRETYNGSYTLANLNPWDALADIVHIEQTFDINAAGEYVNISTISTPASGSRVASYKLPKGTTKTHGSNSLLRRKF